MARRGNIFFLSSFFFFFLFLISCSSLTVLTARSTPLPFMMVHLLARGHFQKQQAGSVCVAGRRPGRSKPHCGLPQRKALRADSCSSNSGSFWNSMGTGSKEGNDQWETLIHNLRSHPSECWTTTPKGPQDDLGSSGEASRPKDHFCCLPPTPPKG